MDERETTSEAVLLAAPEEGVGGWSAERHGEAGANERLRSLLREHCSRLVAPESLRQRILSSLPHRTRRSPY